MNESKRILVVGDIIGDVYRYCSYKKDCPDAAGVPALVEYDKLLVPGGAANVALNAAALSNNIDIDLIGVIDDDISFRTAALSENDKITLWNSANGLPIYKERIFHNGKFVIRVDNQKSIDQSSAMIVYDMLSGYLNEVNPDLIIISDYGAGTLSNEVLNLLLPFKHKLLVDTKIKNLSCFGNENSKTFLIKLNNEELCDVLESGDDIPEARFKYMITTRGAGGATLTTRTELGAGRSQTDSIELPAFKADVVDVCGCGDTFMAALAVSLVNGTDIIESVRFANAAASTVVSQPRTAIADLEKTNKLLKRIV